MKKNQLVGKVVRAVYVANDDAAIRFDVDGEDPIVARCDGECCSTTWIEDVIGVEALIGTPILRAEDVSLPDALHTKTKTDHYEEEMAYYGFVIDTAQGRCLIAYRNSSNGYYGGSLWWPGDGYYYGGVHDQNISKENWKVLAGRPPRGDQ